MIIVAIWEAFGVRKISTICQGRKGLVNTGNWRDKIRWEEIEHRQHYVAQDSREVM